MRVKLRIAAAGSPQRLELEAVSAEEAVRQAARCGYRVLAIECGRPPSRPGAAGRFNLLLFTQELLALLDAGLNVVEALETLRRKEAAGAAAQLLDALIASLREGKSLSDALSLHPAAFPQIYVAGVLASERSGALAQTLSRYAAYQLEIESVKKRVVSASIYPLLLVLVGALVTLFLLGYVVPKFGMVLESANRETAAASRWLLAFGAFIGRHPVPVWGGLATLPAAALVAWRRPAARRWLLVRLGELPGLRRVTAALALARFYRTVALLLDAGIPLLKALVMAAPLLPARLAGVLAGACERVRAGQPLSAALAGTALLTPVAESLIKVGERSGKLAEMMERAARFLDEELARLADRFSRLFEPLLMAAIGLVIGMVVVLMYMPIFDLAGSFG